jgi:hypothetical protein
MFSGALYLTVPQTSNMSKMATHPIGVLRLRLLLHLGALAPAALLRNARHDVVDAQQQARRLDRRLDRLHLPASYRRLSTVTPGEQHGQGGVAHLAYMLI